MYSDTQVLRESMVEDVCNILNNGEVPNLFPTEEKMKIIEEMSGQTSGTPNEKYLYFVQQCKKNLHMVICMSPVGEAFRRRLRTFPALVNCTTIDWFLPWPEEALRSTADTVFIKDMEINQDNLRAGLVNVAVDMQTRV
jgi:dynein heavy chain